MPKPNPLTQGLEHKARPVQPASEAPRRASTGRAAPSRDGRVLIGGHFAPEVQTELKILAARERTTVQALIAEGINTVFAKRGAPEIAEMAADKV